jgi:hypothetical protein
MGTTYSEFQTTGANLLADIRTAILASTDWSRPNAAGQPNLLKATTTRGADMIVDLNDAAPNASRLQFAAYRQHDGTTGVDKNVRVLRTRSNGTFTTNAYRCIVSAGKEHLFISVEGPRAGEAGADHVSGGSLRGYIFLSDVAPYYTGADDTQPCVAFGGGASSDSIPGWYSGSLNVNISRNRGNTESWTLARLAVLDMPQSPLSSGTWAIQRIAKNGEVLLSPYVVFEDADGPRGRLAAFHFAGWNWTDVPDNTTLASGSTHTVNGVKYKVIPVSKGTQNEMSYGAMGFVNNQNNSMRSPLVAVPVT